MDKQEEKTTSNGFKLLHDYFSKLPAEQSLLGTDKEGNHIIHFSWIFTEEIDQEIIKQTISRLIQESEKKYFETHPNKKNKHPYLDRCEKTGRTPDDIREMLIHIHDDDLSVQFVGADNLSKIRIVDKLPENKTFKIPTMDLKQFGTEICNTIMDSPNRDSTPFLNGINYNINNACKNLVAYYQYLEEEKKESITYSCLIDSPNTSKSTKHITRNKHNINSISYERKNDVIPFNLRSEILDNHKPLCMINVDEQKENGDIVPNSYITYVYNNILTTLPEHKKNGYLFISEPLAGDRATRIYYVSKKEFNGSPEAKTLFKLKSIIKKNLEMNQEDFLKAGNIQLSHTNLESYKDRINFFIDGAKGQSMSDYGAYQPRLQKLYRDESIKLPYYKPRATAKDIALLGSQSETGRIDRTAQNILNRSSQEMSHADL